MSVLLQDDVVADNAAMPAGERIAPPPPVAPADAGMVAQAVPIGFDGCAGWLHQAQGAHGVVLCGPVAREGTWTYRAWAALAADLAAAGFPSLRFDYPDMGDSADLPPDSDAVAAWTESIARAVAYLRACTGVVTVSLVGYRVGALLAIEASRDLAGLEGVAVLGPVASGRAYLRELTLAMAARGGGGTGGDGAMEVHGHLLSAATVAHLGRLKLVAPAAKALLLGGDPESGALQRLAQEAIAAGMAVEAVPFADMTRLQGAAHEISVPEETFSQVIDWLRRLPATAAIAPTEPPRAGLTLPNAVETPVRLGRAFGILCMPAGARAGLSMLILNTGGNHRAGEARFAVQLARTIAARGIASLRIDVSRAGDALPVERGTHDELYSDRIVEDVNEAVDFLAGRAPGELMAFGICSGAYVSLHTALRDDRINALLMANPPKFILDAGEPLMVPDASRLRHVDAYRSLAFRKDTWRRVARGEIRVGPLALRYLRQIASRGLGMAQAAMPAGIVLAPRVVRAQDQFRRLRARGVRARVVYGDTDEGLNQLEALFGSDGRYLPRLGAELRFLTGTDHTLTSTVSKARFMAAIEDFLPPPATDRPSEP